MDHPKYLVDDQAEGTVGNHNENTLPPNSCPEDNHEDNTGRNAPEIANSCNDLVHAASEKTIKQPTFCQVIKRWLGMRERISVPRWRAFLIVAFTIIVVFGVIGVTCWLSLRPARTPIFQNSALMAIDTQVDGKVRDILFFYQHSDMSIRFLQHQNETDLWVAQGIPEALVYSNALPGTSITALAYVYKGEMNLRVFFTSADGYLVERISNNKNSGMWYDGSLRSEGLKASKTSGAALAACYSRFFGDQNDTDSAGVHVWYGDNEGVIQQIGWSPKDLNNGWEKLHTFSDLNGNSSADCTARGLPISYLYASDISGNFKILYYKFNLTTRTSYAVKTWTPVIEWKGIKQNTTVSAITFNSTERYVHLISKDNKRVQKKLLGSGENLTWSDTFIIGEKTGMKILPQGGLASVILNSTLGGPELHVFSLIEGGKVVDFIRSFLSTYWATETLPLKR